ncbi:craniofacial development protein 2-like [Capsicum annuum]|uniref:craniofacial development protein 2-like n=1 Tax=Capsicum annuum TaxID=4072 RepID=UPI001FB06DE5|nr:craniofacial development protein 2-like [Capsicum annuum]
MSSGLGERGCKYRFAKGSSRLRVESWNIGTLQEVVKILRKRRVSIACVHETKWKGTKERDSDGYKLWYTGSMRHRNGVGILVDKDLREQVVEVKRVSERLISIKLVSGGSSVNIISAYAPQVGLDKEEKKSFWEVLDEVVRAVPRTEKLFRERRFQWAYWGFGGIDSEFEYSKEGGAPYYFSKLSD